MIWAVNIIYENDFAFLPSICLMTNNDREIQNAAANMIERYRKDALKEVDLRILELQSRNEQEALRLWCEIRERVKLLLDTPTDNSKH